MSVTVIEPLRIQSHLQGASAMRAMFVSVLVVAVFGCGGGQSHPAITAGIVLTARAQTWARRRQAQEPSRRTRVRSSPQTQANSTIRRGIRRMPVGITQTRALRRRARAHRLVGRRWRWRNDSRTRGSGALCGWRRGQVDNRTAGQTRSAAWLGRRDGPLRRMGVSRSQRQKISSTFR